MPYRLFRPKATGTLPLVVYLHSSGGQGDDNLKQMGLGNVYRIYLTGQSMGGAGAWHLLAQRLNYFAAAAILCGSRGVDAVDAIRTPLWNFHGDADAVVPVQVSRERIAALRKAGARPLSTEYAGVGHNVWEWTYTEPSLLSWLFSRRRAA